MAGFVVVEFYGKGDPAFGGSADDRPLGKSGEFLTGCYHRSAVAKFESYDEAMAAGLAAANRREGGNVVPFVLPEDPMEEAVDRAVARGSFYVSPPDGGGLMC